MSTLFSVFDWLNHNSLLCNLITNTLYDLGGYLWLAFRGRRRRQRRRALAKAFRTLTRVRAIRPRLYPRPRKHHVWA